MRFDYGDAVIEVNMPDREASLAEVRRRFRAGEGFALATVNLDHLVKLRAEPAFRAAYAAQDIVVADGNPIVWLSRLAQKPVALVPGSEMVLPLAALARAEGVTIALLGSTDEALAQATPAIEATGAKVVARIAPPMGFDPNGEEAGRMLAEVRASGARLCFLALGAPKQEMLAARGRLDAPEVGFASVGAGLDFLAGRQKRAPKWVQRIAMEWAWRAASAPARLVPRYARCFAILPDEALKAWRQRSTYTR